VYCKTNPHLDLQLPRGLVYVNADPFLRNASSNQASKNSIKCNNCTLVVKNNPETTNGSKHHEQYPEKANESSQT
jgi:hypothetical protein